MSGKLLAEIRQRRPFHSPAAEAYLNVLRTADTLTRALEALLQPFRLTPTQYNVLRILAGAGEAGLSCSEISDRMLTRDPDMTRLLDRLERAGLAKRARESRDRRVITVRLAPRGRALLDELKGPAARFERKSLGRLGVGRLKALIGLLEDVRATVR
jgi:DNA-binding MarR family transcriptional regulator